MTCASDRWSPWLPVEFPVRFVESGDGFSTYEDASGDEVYLAHGSLRRLMPLDEVDLFDFRQACLRHNVRNMIGVLREHVTDAGDVDGITPCNDCAELGHEYDMRGVGGSGDLVCEDCLNNYSYCSDCEDYESEGCYLDNFDRWVCDHCLSNHWYSCDNCESYYPDGEVCCQEYDCGCESPAQHFAMRLSEGHLASDTALTVSLPSGVISDEGVGQIANMLRMAARGMDFDDPERFKLIDLSWRLPDLDSRWQTKEGNYTKRLGKLAYKNHALKLAPEVITQAGNIARAHSQGVDLSVELTRNLNLPREEFAHEDSCWWSDYSESRCALKSNGGFGLRTFGDRTHPSYDGSTQTYRQVEGRAWVMPLRLTDTGALTPTFDTETPDAYVVFNGYGNLEGYAPARIIAQLTGLTYRKIGFECSPMYVNNESGYLVASEEIAQRYTDNGLSLSVSQHADLFHTETANKREFANA